MGGKADIGASQICDLISSLILQVQWLVGYRRCGYQNGACSCRNTRTRVSSVISYKDTALGMGENADLGTYLQWFDFGADFDRNLPTSYVPLERYLQIKVK